MEELAFELEVESPEELWEGFIGGSVRSTALIQAQPADVAGANQAGRARAGGRLPGPRRTAGARARPSLAPAASRDRTRDGAPPGASSGATSRASRRCTRPTPSLELSVRGERSVIAGAEADRGRPRRTVHRRRASWSSGGRSHPSTAWRSGWRSSLGEGHALRQRQYLHVRDGLVVRHWVYSAPPRSTEPPPEEDDAGRRAVEQVGPVEHQEVLASTGWSGARLERALLKDGRRVVAKRLAPGGDWLGRASGDRGREALLQRDVLHRLPPEIDNGRDRGGRAGRRLVARDARRLGRAARH